MPQSAARCSSNHKFLPSLLAASKAPWQVCHFRGLSGLALPGYRRVVHWAASAPRATQVVSHACSSRQTTSGWQTAPDSASKREEASPLPASGRNPHPGSTGVGRVSPSLPSGLARTSPLPGAGPRLVGSWTTRIENQRHGWPGVLKGWTGLPWPATRTRRNRSGAGHPLPIILISRRPSRAPALHGRRHASSRAATHGWNRLDAGTDGSSRSSSGTYTGRRHSRAACHRPPG